MSEQDLISNGHVEEGFFFPLSLSLEAGKELGG